MTMADRISVMDQGRIVQTATPAEIYEAPNSRYVADFIGSVNLLEGIVRSAGPARVQLDAKAGLRIELESAASLPPGRPAWFAVRPEKVRIAHAAPNDTAANAVAGEVWDIAYLGDMTLYNVKIASGEIMRASTMNAAREVARPITWEDRVWLSWTPDAGIVLAN